MRINGASKKVINLQDRKISKLTIKTKSYYQTIFHKMWVGRLEGKYGFEIILESLGAKKKKSPPSKSGN